MTDEFPRKSSPRGQSRRQLKRYFLYYYSYILSSFISLQWVGPLGDMKAEFEAIDTNHGGYILFSEFITWASKKNLDLEDDIDELVD